LPECRDAQQHDDAIPLPELQQQQQFCIEADSLPLRLFKPVIGAK